MLGKQALFVQPSEISSIALIVRIEKLLSDYVKSTVIDLTICIRLLKVSRALGKNLYNY